jgi:hypothetical protein
MNCHYFFALLLFAGSAIAEDIELVTDRPDQTESAVVVQPGHVQVETGATFTSDDGDTVEYPTTLVRIGLDGRVELRLGLPGWTSELDGDSSPAFGDAEVGAKVRLWNEHGLRPEAALLFGVSVPVGSDAVSTKNLDPAFRLSFAHTLSERVSLGYNVGVAWETTEDETAQGLRIKQLYPQFQWEEKEADTDTLASFEYTAALGIGLTDRLSAFIEVFGDAPLNAHGDTAHSLDGGFTYLLRPNVQLDLSAGVGLNDAADDWFVGAGVSFRLPR